MLGLAKQFLTEKIQSLTIHLGILIVGIQEP